MVQTRLSQYDTLNISNKHAEVRQARELVFNSTDPHRREEVGERQEHRENRAQRPQYVFRSRQVD